MLYVAESLNEVYNTVSMLLKSTFILQHAFVDLIISRVTEKPKFGFSVTREILTVVPYFLFVI